MFKKLCGLLLLGCTSSFADTVSTELDFFDTDRQRPVKVKFWYPSDGQCEAKLCIDAQAKNKKVPLAILSHGAFGSPREMNWLGYSLASQGWLVAGIAHYQESWVYGPETIDHASAGKLWLRSEDAHFVLDTLLNNNPTNRLFDPEKVIVIGHSSGGYTALNLVGADLNLPNMQQYCSEKVAADLSCQYGDRKSSNNPSKSGAFKTLDGYTDPRIKAVIALDPALGPAVTIKALSKITVPVLIAGSVDNDFLSFQHHAKYYASHIANAQLLEVDKGAGHFVYLDKCEHQHKAMGVPLCVDKEGVNRQQIQHELVGRILAFVARI